MLYELPKNVTTKTVIPTARSKNQRTHFIPTTTPPPPPPPPTTTTTTKGH
jgi:hypothetical protein